ncbi:MAG: hypothetical protein LBH00_06035 [Planctomycetaceae bacterium]|jgi:hypothetical protein|nr:hypothetical protein [Planctomycetaceae bacterium]
MCELIHVRSQLPVWEYRIDSADVSSVNIDRIGNTVVLALDNKIKKTTTVCGVSLLPAPSAVKAILDLLPEKQFMLRSGMEIALKIDPQFKYLRRVRYLCRRDNKTGKAAATAAGVRRFLHKLHIDQFSVLAEFIGKKRNQNLT